MHQSQQAPIPEVPQDPFQALHLRPTAPQELIVEVYWHLVHRLQLAARQHPSLRSSLDQLNEAYAAIVGHQDHGSQRTGDGHAIKRHTRKRAPSKTSTWLGRLLRREGRGRFSAATPQPWELLHLDPSAPPDIVELAYGFCRLRLRSQRGEFATQDLEKLQEAYEELRRSMADIQRDGRTARPEDQPAPPAQATSGAAELRTLEANPPSAAAAEAAPAAAAGPPPTTAVATPPPAQPEAAREPTAEPDSPPDAAVADGASEEDAPGRDTPEEIAASIGPTPVEEASRAGAAGPATSKDVGERARPVSADDRVAELVGSAPVTETASEEEQPDEADRHSLPKSEVSSPVGSETGAPQQTRPAKALAHLIAESGEAREIGAAIGAGAFTIGTDPTCDFVVAAPNAEETGVLARIWAQGDRFMLHVLASAPTILVSGQPVSWAVLEDGDKLEIGDDVLRFQRAPQHQEGG